MEDHTLRRTVRDRLVRLLQERAQDNTDPDAARALADVLVGDLTRDRSISESVARQLVYDAFHELYGFGAIQSLMLDPDVTEIMINGPNRVFLERDGQMSELDHGFEDQRSLAALVERLLMLSPGKRLDQTSPMVDLSLPDGTRIHIAIPPVVAGGTHVTVRKYARTVETREQYVDRGCMSEEMSAFLSACVRGRRNVLLAGAAGTGKTTLLEVLSREFDPHERIVVIEDTLELHLRQPNVVRLLSRAPNIEGKGEITITDLFRNSLRMRPTRVVLGELRGREVLDFLQALNSGHRGAFGVLHAASPEQAVDRLENLVPYSSAGLPVAVIRRQIAHGLDLVVQLDQLPDGSRKITRISEVLADLDRAGEVGVRDLFRFVATGLAEDGTVLGSFEATGIIPTFYQDLVIAGTAVSRQMFAA